PGRGEHVRLGVRDGQRALRLGLSAHHRRHGGLPVARGCSPRRRARESARIERAEDIPALSGMRFGLRPGISLMLVALAGCADTATLPIERQLGANPALPAPVHSLIPTVKVAEATGWPRGAKPTPASGWQVSAFATGLDHPRWLLVLP